MVKPDRGLSDVVARMRAIANSVGPTDIAVCPGRHELVTLTPSERKAWRRLADEVARSAERAFPQQGSGRKSA